MVKSCDHSIKKAAFSRGWWWIGKGYPMN